MEISKEFVMLVPLVMGLVEALKGVGLNTRFAPLVSVLLGLGFASMANLGFSSDAALQGVLVGLTAAGIYSGGKATLGK